MENVGIENFILIIIAAGYFIFKSVLNKGESAEVIEEYEPSSEEGGGVETVEPQQLATRRVKVDKPIVDLPQSPSRVSSIQEEPKFDDKSVELEDFDIRQAVIMSEILHPKHKEMS